MGASCCGLLEDVIDTRLPTVNMRSRSTVHTQGSSSSRRTTFGSSIPSRPRCRRCGQFGVQHTCSDCRHTFCQSCCALHSNAMWLCVTCLCLDSTGFTKDLLMRVKVKELRDYLAQHGICTDTCREKEDLVDLVMNHRRIPTAPMPSGYSQATVEPFVEASISRPPTPPSVTTSSPTSTVPPLQEPEVLDEGTDRGSDAEGEEDPQVAAGPLRISLSDLTSVEEVASLSVREMKTLLRRNFVDYKGCCERWELEERVRRLYEDTQRLQAGTGEVTRVDIASAGLSASEDHLCKVCMDSPIDCVLLECGHMVTCTKCGKRMSECPICRQYVVRAVHVFRT
uniref:Ring finger and FYVE-like domain containing E3 ubiquitin protein ligase n=1 Tax=Eptatretus burgeri TaxID=7764 RepID=A0A8C4N6Y2_EPTBU